MIPNSNKNHIDLSKGDCQDLEEMKFRNSKKSRVTDLVDMKIVDESKNANKRSQGEQKNETLYLKYKFENGISII